MQWRNCIMVNRDSTYAISVLECGKDILRTTSSAHPYGQRKDWPNIQHRPGVLRKTDVYQTRPRSITTRTTLGQEALEREA
jgi:hypothetical protein